MTHLYKMFCNGITTYFKVTILDCGKVAMINNNSMCSMSMSTVHVKKVFYVTADRLFEHAVYNFL